MRDRSAGALAIALLLSTVLPPSRALAAPTCFGRPPTIVGTELDDVITGTSGVDVIVVVGRNDEVDGRGGDDLICGGIGSDRLGGGVGDDRIDGGPGIDQLRGGGGNDEVIARCGDCEDPGGEYQHIYGGGGNDVLSGSIEEEDIFGGPGADRIVGGGSLYGTLEGEDRLEGGPGDDEIVSGSTRGWGDTVGTVVLGGDGDDTLRDLDGVTVLYGGPGDDTFVGAGACCTTVSFSEAGAPIEADIVAGVAAGEGSDTLDGIRGLEGSEFNDLLVGSKKGDLLEGSDGSDVVSGGGGDDRVSGGLGDDTLAGDTGADEVSFSSSPSPVTADLVAGTATGEGEDLLSGFENIEGSPHGDVLLGNDSANDIDGGWGFGEVLSGRGGDDVLEQISSGSTVDGGDVPTASMLDMPAAGSLSMADEGTTISPAAAGPTRSMEAKGAICSTSSEPPGP